MSFQAKEKAISVIDELDKKRIAVVAGTTTEDIVRRVAEVNDFRIKVVPIKTHDEGMDLLNNGKVDGYASDRAMLIGQVFRNANVANNYTMTRSALSFEPYAFMITRGDTQFRLAADRALASLYRTARIRRIYQNWFGRYGEPLSPIVEAVRSSVTVSRKIHSDDTPITVLAPSAKPVGARKG